MTRIKARNSAPSSRKRAAALKNAKIKNSTEWTGLRADTTMTEHPTSTKEKSQKQIAWMIMCRSSIGRVERDILGELGLPAVAIGEELVLVVEKLLARLGGELEVRPFDDRVDRAGLLAEPAIDAFGHVDVVARRAPAAVLAGLGLDGDGKRGTDGLAELAGDAALLAIGIAPERVFAAKARRQRPLLIGIVHRDRRLEHVFEREPQALDQLPEQHRARAAIQKRHVSPRPPASAALP